MRITFVSNFMSSHQYSFSNKMYEICNGEYYFVACTPISESRLKLGFLDENKSADYIIRTYESVEQYNFAKKLMHNSDVVIFGSGNEDLFKLRMQYKDKITLRYTERLFKKNPLRRFIPIVYKHMYDRYIKYRNNDKFAILCASAYTSHDLRLCGFPIDKCYKWGYFPDVIEYDIDNLLNQKHKNSILWVGRFLDWKHPEVPILLAKKLKESGYSFKLNIIGTGDMQKKLETLILHYNLTDYVELLGAKTPREVREYMEKSQIFLSTSDRNEGWGAVLNEAMNSGCAVVASHMIGAAPFLIDDGKNGIIYQSGKAVDLYNNVKALLDNNSKCVNLGKNAYITMSNEWNAKNAAEKLMTLIDNINNHKHSSICEGVCSTATPLKDNWYNNKSFREEIDL